MTEKGPNYFILNQKIAQLNRAESLKRKTENEKIEFANRIRSYFLDSVNAGKFNKDHILTVQEICAFSGLNRTKLFNKLASLFPQRSIKQILELMDLPFEEKAALADIAFSKESIHQWFIDTTRKNNRKPPTQKQVSQAVIDGLLPPQEEFKKITGYTLVEYKKSFKAKVELGEYAL